MQEDLVSVIIPIYNIEAFLPRCIESVLAQSYHNLEVLLIDDGSTDRSGEICDRFASTDDRIRVFHNANAGLSSSRNFGLEHTSGKWISFIDGDDWIATDFISILHQTAVCNHAEVSFCDWYFAYEDKNVENACFNPGDSKVATLSNLILEAYHVVWNKLYLKSFLDAYSLVFPQHIQKYEEDSWFSCRVFFYANVVAKAPQPLYYYNRENPGAITRTYKSDEARNVRYLVYADLLAFFEQHNAASDYKSPIYWRVQQEKSWMILQPQYHASFNEILPETNHHILSNPLLGWKMKLLMWIVSKQRYGIARFLLSFVHDRS